MDLDYRKEWDSYVGSIEKINENNNPEIIYWDVKYGIPFISNRDYVYCREMKGFYKGHLCGILCFILLAKCSI